MIEGLLANAQTFSTLSGIEQCLEKSRDSSSSSIPLPSLYVALKRLHPQDCSRYLERLTPDQRQALLDIDLWDKDNLDMEHFPFWPLVYCEASDSVRFEFVQSPSFALFLKARFNIQTFDIENPQYPSHDHYFLTEDNLLLIEYDEGLRFVDELKSLIGDIYRALGVENAYAHLLKIISDTYSPMLEEEYHLKKGRLLDLGLMDYYDALNILRPFANREIMDNALLNKRPSSRNSPEAPSPSIPLGQALKVFQHHNDPLREELSRVESRERAHVLQLDFTRLINASLVLDNALKSGDNALYEVGHTTRAYLLLGLDYTLHKKGHGRDESLFDHFEFGDFYRYGKTLVEGQRRALRRALKHHSFREDDPFLGAHWIEFVEHSLCHPPKHRGDGPTAKDIVSLAQYLMWSKDQATFVELLPFMATLARRFYHLKETNTLRDDFYLNYNVDDIDFEAIMLSSLANFFLGHYENPSLKKMGLTLDEFKHFALAFTSNAQDNIDKGKTISRFAKSFGPEGVSFFGDYIVRLLEYHLGGHEYSSMRDKDYCHVGGAIILNTASRPNPQ